MVTVFDSIVKIYDESSKPFKGIGFVIKQDDEYSYILSCNHVVYSSQKSEKRKVKIDDGIEVESIIYGHELKETPVDLAILKVKNLSNKITISLQHNIDKSSILKLKTLSPISNDALSFDPKSIQLEYRDKEPLDYCHNPSDAYLFRSGSRIEGGYSGSPIIDDRTNKVIGILNITREEQSRECKGLAISNVVKIFPEIESELKIISKKSNKITVVARVNSRQTYDFILNNDDETFLNFDINDQEQQRTLVDYIFDLTGGIPNKTIEFFLPPKLFSVNIHLWKSSRNRRLIEKHSVYLRSLNLAKTSGELKAYWEKKWDKDYAQYQEKLFKESITVIDEDRQFHPDIVSAVCDGSMVFEEDDFMDLEDDFISIAIWKSECEDGAKYDSFIDTIKEQGFYDFRQAFKSEIFKRKRCCSSHTVLMWNNPRDLPKKDLRNG